MTSCPLINMYLNYVYVPLARQMHWEELWNTWALSVESPCIRLFIASNFNHCNIVWHFCVHTNSLKIEKVHKKSLNVVLNDYLSPYHILLEKVKRPTMYVSRMKSIGLEVSKCLHKCSPTYITDMFSISASPYDTRGGIKLIQPRVNSTRNVLYSFRYQGAKIWNELPTSVKNTEDVSEFKYRLNEWPAPVCEYGSCELCKFINIWTAFLWLAEVDKKRQRFHVWKVSR